MARPEERRAWLGCFRRLAPLEDNTVGPRFRLPGFIPSDDLDGWPGEKHNGCLTKPHFPVDGPPTIGNWAMRTLRKPYS